MRAEREDGARVDLHLHSRASGTATNIWVQGLGDGVGVRESYTPPEEAYRTVKRAGMDFVTLTDHETIAREGIDNVEIRDGLIEGGPGSPDRFDGALAIGPLYYVRNLLPALSAVGAGLEPGGWGVFTVPLRSLEGTWQVVSELLARRRAFLRSPAEATLTAERAGLEVLGTGLTGTSRGGLSLVLKTVTLSDPLSRRARDTRPQETS